MSLLITPSVFHGGGKAGDFGWMIKQDAYSHAFFIFNDNEAHYLAFQDGGKDGCRAGGGNAEIRPYQCATPPRAGGIPTGDYAITSQGSNHGYPDLTPLVRRAIDTAVATIKSAIDANGYTEVIYSSDGKGGLGTSIFSPNPAVTQYIVGKINALAD